MTTGLPQNQIEHRHGCILSLSHAFNRKLTICRKSNTLSEQSIAEWDELKRVVDILIECLSDQQPLLVSAAIKGVSLIGSQIKLPLATSPVFETAESSSVEKMDCEEPPKSYSKSFLAESILRLLKSANSRPKIREESAYCLGYLAIGDAEHFTQKNLNEFKNLTKLVRQNKISTKKRTLKIFFLILFPLDKRCELKYSNSSGNRIDCVRL